MNNDVHRVPDLVGQLRIDRERRTNGAAQQHRGEQQHLAQSGQDRPCQQPSSTRSGRPGNRQGQGGVGQVGPSRSRGRSVLPAALLAVSLVGGCGGTSHSTTTTAPAPAASAPAGGAPAPGAAAPSPSDAGSDAAPIAATCPSSNTTAFAKTKFVAHAGLAFGVFHRYLYKPYQAGAFASGRQGRVVALAKAGASALFIKREVRLASEDVKANPALCNALAAPLADLGNSIGGAVQRLRSGDGSGLGAAQTEVAAIEGKAGASGDTITEDPNPPVG